MRALLAAALLVPALAGAEPTCRSVIPRSEMALRLPDFGSPVWKLKFRGAHVQTGFTYEFYSIVEGGPVRGLAISGQRAPGMTTVKMMWEQGSDIVMYRLGAEAEQYDEPACVQPMGSMPGLDYVYSRLRPQLVEVVPEG